MTSFPSIVDLLGVPFFRPPVFFPRAMCEGLKLKRVGKVNDVSSPCNINLNQIIIWAF